MSRPVDPYRGGDDRRAPNPQWHGQPQHGQPPYGGQPQYGQPPHGQPQYGQPQYGQHQPRYQEPRFQEPQPEQPRHERPARTASAGRSRGIRRLLGLGLVLIVVAVVVQLLSLTVSMPDLWRAVTGEGTSGFGGWYLVLFSYPLAALSILLALASVLESAALKVIWGGLAIVGLGVLVLRYGLGPFTGLAAGDGLSFTRQEITTATIAAAALVVVILLLRMAVTTFRRVAGLILLAISGVHVAAVWDLSSVQQFDLGAYGPALGYLLTAVAAFVGPHRLLP